MPDLADALFPALPLDLEGQAVDELEVPAQPEAEKPPAVKAQRTPALYPLNQRIIVGDALTALKRIPDESCRACVTSPPYWGLRDYGIAPQIGAESSVHLYIANLTLIFGQVRRILTPDGTLWLNIGDSYTSGDRTWRAPDKKNGARAMRYRQPTPMASNQRT